MNKEQTQNTKLVLECKAVSKEYVDSSSRIKVLNNVAFQLKAGEQVAIMGRSGSGKTTLLQLLGGLDLPTAGQVLLNGHNLKDLNERELEKMRNRSIGFIYQFHHLLPEFTALENVAMPQLVGKIPPKIATARAHALLEKVGLADRFDHKPAELSGGERQRVAIARALINDPDCLLADEPTGNLDDENALHVLDILQALNREQNTSIIIVTHDPDLAARMDRTLHLHGGQLV
jgi:lipoprotein-releasing system ATP-binding protein